MPGAEERADLVLNVSEQGTSQTAAHVIKQLTTVQRATSGAVSDAIGRVKALYDTAIPPAPKVPAGVGAEATEAVQRVGAASVQASEQVGAAIDSLAGQVAGAQPLTMAQVAAFDNLAASLRRVMGNATEAAARILGIKQSMVETDPVILETTDRINQLLETATQQTLKTDEYADSAEGWISKLLGVADAVGSFSDEVKKSVDVAGQAAQSLGGLGDLLIGSAAAIQGTALAIPGPLDDLLALIPNSVALVVGALLKIADAALNILAPALRFVIVLFKGVVKAISGVIKAIGWLLKPIITAAKSFGELAKRIFSVKKASDGMTKGGGEQRKYFRTTVRHSFASARALDIVASAMQGVTLAASITSGNLVGVAMSAVYMRRAMIPILALFAALASVIMLVAKSFTTLKDRMMDAGKIAQDTIHQFRELSGVASEGARMWATSAHWAMRYGRTLEETREGLIGLWKQGLLTNDMFKAAIGLSAAWNMSLTEATQILAAAVGEEEQNVEALREYGIVVGELTDETSRVAVAADVARAALERFGDSADQRLKTLTGALQRIQTAIQFFWEMWLEPITTGAIVPLLTAIGNFAASLSTLAARFWKLEGGMDYFNATIAKARGLVERFVPELNTLANIVRMVVVASFWSLQRTLRTVVNLAERFLMWVRQVFSALKQLTGPLKPLADMFRMLAQSWKELSFTALLQRLKELVYNIAPWLENLVRIFKTAWNLIVWGVREFLVEPFKRFIGGFIVELQRWFPGAGDILKNLADAFEDALPRIKAALEPLAVVFQTLGEVLGRVMGAIVGALGLIAGAVLETVTAFLSGDLESIPDIWAGTWDKIKEYMGGLWADLEPSFALIYKKFWEFYGNLFGKEAAATAAGKVGAFISEVKKAYEEGGLGAAVKLVFKKAWKGVSDFLKTVWTMYVKPRMIELWKDHILPWIKDTAWPWLKDTLAWLWGEVANWLLHTAFPKVAEWLGTLWVDHIRPGLVALSGNIGYWLGTVAMRGLGSDMEVLGRGIGEMLIVGIRAAWQEAKSVILDMLWAFGAGMAAAIVNGIIQSLHDLWGLVTSAVGALVGDTASAGGYPGYPPPSYQYGGVARTPHMAKIGEVPEAIIPLKGGAVPVTLLGAAGGGMNISVLVTGNNIASPADADYLADEVADKILRELGHRGVGVTGRW